jgi:hypothetical protein
MKAIILPANGLQVGSLGSLIAVDTLYKTCPSIGFRRIICQDIPATYVHIDVPNVLVRQLKKD